MTVADLKPAPRRRSARALATIAAACALCLLCCAGARAAGGTAMAWGQDGLGQLGNGAPVTNLCGCIANPVPVKGLAGATEIAAGSGHGLALLANGTVMAWGSNNTGQLGNGTTADSAAPIPVPGLANVVAIAAGPNDSFALLGDGTVRVWGDNTSGGLGQTVGGPEVCSGLSCSKAPVPVPGLANAIAIAANGNHGYALLGDGTVMAWGHDGAGEDGHGSGSSAKCECFEPPTPVPGVSGAMGIAAQSRGGLAVLGDGTLRAWGLNTSGELGTGAATSAAAGGCGCLGPVAVAGVSGAREAIGGGDHGMAILSSGGSAAWGANFYGELGNGGTDMTECKCNPTPGAVAKLSPTRNLAAGASHSVALLANGSVLAWGDDISGEIGDGTATGTARPAPIQVAGVGGASDVAAGSFDSFALIGPSQTLKVTHAGAGTGTVGGSGILCPPSCAGSYPQGQVEILRAEPAAASGFAGFTGACRGTGACEAKLDADQTVVATFGPPKGTRIAKTKVDRRKRSATFSFDAPGAITGFECMLIKPKAKGRHRKAKPRFARCASPKRYRHLRAGRYRFEVRALDVLGADAHPALKRFRLRAGKH